MIFPAVHESEGLVGADDEVDTGRRQVDPTRKHRLSFHCAGNREIGFQPEDVGQPVGRFCGSMLHNGDGDGKIRRQMRQDLPECLNSSNRCRDGNEIIARTDFHASIWIGVLERKVKQW